MVFLLLVGTLHQFLCCFEAVFGILWNVQVASVQTEVLCGILFVIHLSLFQLLCDTCVGILNICLLAYLETLNLKTSVLDWIENLWAFVVVVFCPSLFFFCIDYWLSSHLFFFIVVTKTFLAAQSMTFYWQKFLSLYLYL